jgi:hypothetical protein
VNPSTPNPDFEAKVRFSRLVEECLAEPVLPEAPHLQARVRARVALEALRRRRRAQLRRTALAGSAALAVVCGLAVVAEPWARAGIQRALSAGPLARALSAYLAAVSAFFTGFNGLGTVALLTLASLVGAMLLYLLRDLFTDPLRGLVPSAHPRR